MNGTIRRLVSRACLGSAPDSAAAPLLSGACPTASSGRFSAIPLSFARVGSPSIVSLFCRISARPSLSSSSAPILVSSARLPRRVWSAAPLAVLPGSERLSLLDQSADRSLCVPPDGRAFPPIRNAAANTISARLYSIRSHRLERLLGQFHTSPAEPDNFKRSSPTLSPNEVIGRGLIDRCHPSNRLAFVTAKTPVFH